MSLPETRCRERGEGAECTLHISLWVLLRGPRVPLSFRVSPWLDANMIPPVFTGLAADIKTPLQTWTKLSFHGKAPANPCNKCFWKCVSFCQIRIFTLAGSARSSVPGGSSSWATGVSLSSLTIAARLDLESSSLSWTNSSSDRKCLGWLLCTWSLNLRGFKTGK